VIQLPPVDCINFAAGLGLKLYPWQKSALANVQAGSPTAIVAANGSGKTSTILTPAALWCLHTWPLAKVVVTSASHSQLEKQFFGELSRYQNHILFRGWKFLASEIQSGQGGYIVGVSVDNPGRMEGFHEGVDSPLMIIADEAKSVANLVFTAIDKCRHTFKVYASSAGPAVGRFYECFTTRRDYWHCITVKSSDCPHIPKALIDRDRAMDGEASDEFRTKHLAEFVGADGRSCIRAEDVRLAIDSPPDYEDGPCAYFIDWSATADGDFIVVSKWSGNRGEILLVFRDTPVQSVRRVAAFLKERGINEVYADGGGVGIPMNDQLWEATGKLVNVRAVNNGSQANDPEAYANLSAEVWCEFGRELEKRKLILPNDGELVKQLTGRRRTYDDRNRVRLESKATMRARGLPSPDLADSLIGSWSAARDSQNGEDYAAKVKALVAGNRLRNPLGQILDFGTPFRF
jgi:hypothetical protein